MDIGVMVAVMLAGVIVVAVLFFLTTFGKKRGCQPQTSVQGDDLSHDIVSNTRAGGDASDTKKAKSGKRAPVGTKQPQFSHPWLAGRFSGAADQIKSLAVNDRYLAASSSSGTIYAWDCRHLDSAEHSFTSHPIQLDEAQSVSSSPDGKCCLALLKRGGAFRVFRFTKKDGGGITLQQGPDIDLGLGDDIAAAEVSPNGKFMAAVSYDDRLIVTTLKGDQLATTTAKHGGTSGVCVNTNGELVATYGNSSDVKVFGMKFDSKGEFRSLSRAFELTGHTSAVLRVAFSPDARRAVSASRDGTARCWNVDVDWQHGQDGKQLFSVPFESREAAAVAVTNECAVVASGSTLRFYDSETGVSLRDVVLPSDGVVNALALDATYSYLLVGHKKNIYSLHNVPHQLRRRSKLTEQLALTKTGAMKERIRDQITELDAVLKLASEA